MRIRSTYISLWSLLHIQNPFSLIMIKIVIMELNYKVKQVYVSIKLYLINIW